MMIPAARKTNCSQNIKPVKIICTIIKPIIIIPAAMENEKAFLCRCINVNVAIKLLTPTTNNKIKPGIIKLLNGVPLSDIGESFSELTSGVAIIIPTQIIAMIAIVPVSRNKSVFMNVYYRLYNPASSPKASICPPMALSTSDFSEVIY